MTQEVLLKKLSKLLALATGSVQNEESKAALQKIKRLLKENNLDMSDIISFTQESERTTNLGEMGEQVLNEEYRQYRHWETRLLNALAYLFDCKVMQTKYISSRKKSYYIIGRESNRRTCELMFNWLKNRTQKEAIDKCKHVGNRVEYCNGVATGILMQIQSLKHKSAMNEEGLVPLDEVQRYIREEYADINSLRIKWEPKHRGRAYMAGFETGENTSLNHQFGLKSIE